MSKKLPTKTTTEDLLESLKNEDILNPTLLKPKEDSITDFLRFYNIGQGDNKISAITLYKLYKAYAKNPVSELKFFITIKQYFIVILISGRHFYMIDQKAINLSSRAYNLVESQKKPMHKSTNWQMHFENFVKKFNIQSGKETHYIWISNELLFDLYDQWVYKIRKRRPLNEKEFVKLCKVYFGNFKENHHLTYFKLNDSIIELLTAEKISAFEARKSLKNVKKEKKSKRKY